MAQQIFTRCKKCGGEMHDFGLRCSVCGPVWATTEPTHAHMMAAPTTREPAPDPLQAHVEMIAALTAERDSLRSEVERLNAMVDAMCGLDYERFLELERLRKGREDGQNRGDDSERGRDGDCMGVGIRTSGDGNLATLADNLDPRLGMQMPEGEPVGPRPMRRWGML